MEHRKTPSRNVYVPPSWLVVLTAAVCVVALAGIVWLIVDGSGGDDGSPPTVAPTRTATTTPTPTETTATPTPTPTPTETTKPAPTVDRSGIAVSVLNNTGTPGAAGAFATKVRNAGWTVGGVGNWRGSVPTDTVYYPSGHEAEATQLGKDVGIDRIRPSVAPMRTDRLTIILAGPQ